MKSMKYRRQVKNIESRAIEYVHKVGTKATESRVLKVEPEQYRRLRQSITEEGAKGDRKWISTEIWQRVEPKKYGL